MTTTGQRSRRRSSVAEALDLHGRGLSPHRIAVQMGTTPKRVASLLAEGFAAMPEQTVDQIRTGIELRLDHLAAVCGELLSDPDPKVRSQGVRDLARIESDRSRLLGAWIKGGQPDEDDR